LSEIDAAEGALPGSRPTTPLPVDPVDTADPTPWINDLVKKD
jgi:hypothetical protein